MRIVFIDSQTTGASPAHDRMLQWRMLETEDGIPTGRHFRRQFDPGVNVDPDVLLKTVGRRDFQGLSTFNFHMDDIERFLEGAVVASHNGWFDLTFLQAEFSRHGKHEPDFVTQSGCDTFDMMARLFRAGGVSHFSTLEKACKGMGIPFPASPDRGFMDPLLAHADLWRKLDALDFDPNQALNERGVTPFLNVLEAGEFAIAARLSEKGANTETRTMDGLGVWEAVVRPFSFPPPGMRRNFGERVFLTPRVPSWPVKAKALREVMAARSLEDTPLAFLLDGPALPTDLPTLWRAAGNVLEEETFWGHWDNILPSLQSWAGQVSSEQMGRHIPPEQTPQSQPTPKLTRRL
jgi:DNA polymerase III epsilon subunit-like protein